MYHFVPKKGVGVQKDGHKLHFFDYEASFHNRSKDFYGEEIFAAIEVIKQGQKHDDKAEDVMTTPEKEERAEGEKMRHRLSNLLVAAYTDLVMDGNSDMTSYMYLMDKATYALSKEVKEQLRDLKNDGGVALALVTELVATSSSAQGLFARAVLSRELMDDLEGLEGINESYVRKAYAAITPRVETKGILVNNGVNVSNPNNWGYKLAEAAPSFNQLVGMDFNSFKRIVPPSSGGIDGCLSDLRAPSGQELIAYQMYAGLIAPPSSQVAVPPVRGYLLENGLNPEIAYEMEKLGHTDLTAVDDKDIYQSAQTFLEGLPGEFPEERTERDTFVKRKLMNAHQSSLKDKANGVQPQKRWKSAFGRVSSANKTVGALKGGVRVSAGSALAKGVTAGAATAGAGAVGAGAGMAGMAATAASGLAAIAGPLAVAVALAPVIKDLASSTEMAMDRDMDSAIAEREKISAEVEDLLKKVETSTEDDLEEVQNIAKDLLDRVRNPTALALSQNQGMGLQKQLHALETRFSPTNMASLVPYTSNEELVAGVDSGKALKAVSIFVDPTEKIATPQRQMLETPRYVNFMGPSVPFRTFTRRTTSENEARSFASSISHIGLSTASKTVSSSSRSTNGGANIIVAGAKAKQSSATTETGGTTDSIVDSKEFKEEQNKKAHQAIISEFTVMPMQTFRLREGGLSLTPYAYYRLQRITNDIDFHGRDINNEPESNEEEREMKEMKREIVRRQKAREFIRNFGSHIPFGVQTLGGIFVRTMKITTKEATSLSELYSTAASRLTTTNEEATMTNTTATGRYGILGLGPSLTSSTGFSKARASGETKDTKEAEGVGRGATSMNSTFESDVICFGPNAATQDDLYQQLMSNNRTWTVIDRGEPDSYFAIWDFIDYLGQGTLFESERQLLKDAWEEMALSNSININIRDNSNVLMSSIMRDYEVKKKIFNFVHALIYCLVPKTGYEYNLDLAENFKQFIVRGRDALSEGNIFDPNALIEKVTKEEVTKTPSNSGSGQGMAGMNQRAAKMSKTTTKLELKFELVDGNEGYQLATEIMKEIPSIDWENHFSYYTDTFTRAILEKGKPSFLYDVCTVCLSSTDENNWDLFDRIVESFNHDEKSKLILDKYLNHRDEESGNYCLHLVVQSNNLDLVAKVCNHNPSISLKKNKEGKTPKEIAKKYPNIKRFGFPLSEDDIQNAKVACVWAVDHADRVHFRDEKQIWRPFSDVEIRHISTSNNGDCVWGVGTHGQVYYLRREVSTKWNVFGCNDIIMDSIAVSATGEHVWAIDIDGIVYKGVKTEMVDIDGDGQEQWDFNPENTGFKLKSISVNRDGSKVYGIDRSSGDCVIKKSTGWETYGAGGRSFERVSISPDGKLLWFTDSDGNAYRYEEGRLNVVSTTTHKLRHIVVENDAHAWGTTRNGDVLRYEDSEWIKVNTKRSFKQISACDISRMTTPTPTKKKNSFVYLRKAGDLVQGPDTFTRTAQDLKNHTIDAFEYCQQENNQTFTTNELAIDRILEVFDAKTTLSEKFVEVSSSFSDDYPAPNTIGFGTSMTAYVAQYNSRFRNKASESIGAVGGGSDETYDVVTGKFLIEYVPIKVVCFTVNGGNIQYASIPLNEPVIRACSQSELEHWDKGGFLLDSISWGEVPSINIDTDDISQEMSALEPINIEAPMVDGVYKIKTTEHAMNGCPEGQGLSVDGSSSSENSVWVVAQENDELWEVNEGQSPGIFHITKMPPPSTGSSYLTVFPFKQDKTKVCIQSDEQSAMKWKIVPGQTQGTWRMLTTNHFGTGQAAGWGLGTTELENNNSWSIHVHNGNVSPMDWKFEKRIEYGKYKIKTTHRGWDECPADRGLCVMDDDGDSQRVDGESSWVTAHDGSEKNFHWEITQGSEPDTYTIKDDKGRRLVSFPSVDDNGMRGETSYKVAVHESSYWNMNWKIIPGRIANTWRILTTEFTKGGQEADWGLATWGNKIPSAQRSGVSSWLYVAGGNYPNMDFYFMDWILEKQD